MSGSNSTGRWEYHVERIVDGIDVARLNELGRERWELVSDTQGDHVRMLIFKRPSPTLAEQITLDQRTRVQAERAGAATT